MFFSYPILSINAQSINVTEKNGTFTSTALSGINKFTFDQGQLVIEKNTETNISFSLDQIKLINFSALQNTAGLTSIKNDGSVFLLYPSPVIDILTVQIKKDLPGSYLIGIFSIDGKLLLSKKIDNPGVSEIKLNLSALSKGTYIFHIQNSTASFSSKFQKQ